MPSSISSLNHSSAMEPSIPRLASPYPDGLSPGHNDENADDSFHDDSGYASEDISFVPVRSLNPNHIYEADHHDPSQTWHHQAAALVNAQRSTPTPSKNCHTFYDIVDDSQKSHIPHSPPSLRNRIKSEPDESLSSSNAIGHRCPSPPSEPNILQPRCSPTQPNYRDESLMRSSSIERPRQHEMTLSRDAQLTLTAECDRHIYEGVGLEKERRAGMRKREDEKLR